MADAPSNGGVVKGLEGVLACATSISSIDGAAGELRYRGFEIRDLVDRAPFAEVAQLLWLGRWPSQAERAHFDAEARARSELPDLVAGLLRDLPETAHPLAAMRTALSLEGSLDQPELDGSIDRVLDRAATVHARSATLVGALACRALGHEVRTPRSDLGRTENILWMSTGVEPTPVAVGALEAVLVTYAEHELNASTFTARIVLGTESDYWSAITAAVGALKGPLHGGAVDDAIGLFLEIGSPADVPAYLDGALARKAKIPGFGHRVYRTRDPRAVGMEAHAERLCADPSHTRLLDTARALERELGRRKGLSANVDYYGALVMYLLGLPRAVFSSLIVASRYAGWTAHIVEQLADNRLIRPRASYVGPPPRVLDLAAIAG